MAFMLIIVFTWHFLSTVLTFFILMEINTQCEKLKWILNMTNERNKQHPVDPLGAPGGPPTHSMRVNRPTSRPWSVCGKIKLTIPLQTEGPRTEYPPDKLYLDGMLGEQTKHVCTSPHVHCSENTPLKNKGTHQVFFSNSDWFDYWVLGLDYQRLW
jgi:hypothetical protein